MTIVILKKNQVSKIELCFVKDKNSNVRIYLTTSIKQDLTVI